MTCPDDATIAPYGGPPVHSPTTPPVRHTSDAVVSSAAERIVPEDGSVTIVITCYNHGQFLAAALTSALDQARPAHTIIVIDDGSTDTSATVAEQFPVRYHYQTNAGPSAARNTALSQCQTEFVTFLDADDVLHFNAVEDGVRALQRNPHSGFAFGRFRIQHPNGSLSYVEVPIPDGADAYNAMLRVNFIGSHCAVMYRVQALREIGGFNACLRAAEDHDVYLRILQTRSLCHHRGVVSDYIHHGGNATRDFVKLTASSLQMIDGQRAIALHHPHGARVLAAAYREGPGWWARLAIEDISRGIRSPREAFRATRQAASLLRLYPRAALLVLQRPWIGPPPNMFDARRATPKAQQNALKALFGRRNASDGQIYPAAQDTIVGYYEQRFLERYANDLRGPVIELGNLRSLPYLSAEVPKRLVLHMSSAHLTVTLANAARIPDTSQQCVVALLAADMLEDIDLAGLLTQVRRVLRPGGILLLTLALPRFLASSARSRRAAELLATCQAAFTDVWINVHIEGNPQTHQAAFDGKTAAVLDDTAFEPRLPGNELLVTLRAAMGTATSSTMTTNDTTTSAGKGTPSWSSA